MLDMKFLRENVEAVRRGIQRKGEEDCLEALLEADRQRRTAIEEADALKNRRNVLSKEVIRKAKTGDDVGPLKDESREIGQRIELLDQKRRDFDEKQRRLLLTIPNLPHPSVPEGHGSESNRLVREAGSKPTFDFRPKNHVELGEILGILDFPRATKIAGSGFPLYRGAGATLERALLNFMLDRHLATGRYREVMTPFVANSVSMTGTGQLPKLAADMYYCAEDDLYLIPTAEVPITNMHRDEILREQDLPICYCGYSPCFRREAGSYGKETRGFLRVHQFNKVELVKFVLPETSYDELEALLADATAILDKLEIAYRVMELCTGDLSFAAAKCYDVEVWSPAEEKWLEASSCSNFEDFQARRAQIRFRRENTGKAEFVHTLNGSGLATSRLMVALLERYQTDEGTIRVPDVLKKYTGFGHITAEGGR
ncbi:MAG: serine--tRNA ligase [bacterium]